MIMSDYMAEQVLRQYFSDNSGLYVALYKENGEEVTSSEYSRQAVNFGIPFKDGVYSVTNVNDVIFPEAGADWGYVTDVAIIDDISGGNTLYRGRLEMTRRINVGDALKISAGHLKLTLA